jgi:uncharacterized protein YciI
MAITEEQVGNAVDTVKFATLVKQTYGRSSLTRNAKDTIAQFPVIISAGIPTDDAVIIAKAIEAQYAALMVSVISANSDYDRGKYNNPADYLRTFHNNGNIPTLFRTMDSQLPEDVHAIECELASARTMYALESLVDKDLVMECWDSVDDRFNTSSLNHSYRPEKHTQDAMESVVKNLRALHRPAMEAAADDVLAAAGVAGNRAGKDDMGAPTKADKVQTTQRMVARMDPVTNTPVRNAKKEIIYDKVTTKDEVVRAPSATGRQEIVRNDKLTTLEPTLINLQLNSHHGNAPVITHNVVMGVKAMIRQIPQQYIVSNLIEGVNNSRAIFGYVKFTEHPVQTLIDLVTGWSTARETAVSDRDMRKWIQALKRRKTSDLIGKMASGEGMPPLTTIVITTYEAEQIAEATNIDLNDPYAAAKLISKYYLLGFIIYDSATGKVKSIFDGDSNFSVTTLNGLKSKQQKDQELTQFASFLRASGRM